MNYSQVAKALLLSGLLWGAAHAKPWTQREKSATSNAAMKVLDQRYGQSRRGQASNRVRSIFRRVAAQTQNPNAYRLIVEQDDSSINAYALPDGRIVILTGLLNALPAGDDDAVAFVVAHEMSHVEHRHAERKATQGGIANLAIGLLTGNSDSNLVRAAGAVGSNLMTSGYSRGMEVEADREGVELMARAGYNPRGALTTLDLFRRLEAQNGRTRVFPTHPPATDRYRDVEGYLNQQ